MGEQRAPERIVVEAASEEWAHVEWKGSSSAFGPTTFVRADRYDALLAALRPLARIADFADEGRMGDDVGIWTRDSNIPGRDFALTVGDCRRARAAIDAATREE